MKFGVFDHMDRGPLPLAEQYENRLKLAEAYGGIGIRAEKPAELDEKILQMIKTPHPVIFDCRVASLANCFPMIPSGKAHNEMLLGEDVSDEEVGSAIDAKGKELV